MAKRTYKVKAGDTYANLGYPSNELMKLNPGVPKLSEGQTIFLPSSDFGNLGVGSKNTTPSTPNLGTYNNSPYLGFQTPTSSTAFNPVFAGMQAQGGAVPIQPIRPPSAVALQNPAGLPVLDGMTQTSSTVVNNLGGGTPSTAARPSAPYTGGNSPSDIAWRNYWNQSATAGSDVAQNSSPPPVHIPTRSEVWEMKAAQRRRRMAKNGEENQTGGQAATLLNPGNAVNTSISWRTG